MSEGFPRAEVERDLRAAVGELSSGEPPVDALVDYLALLHRWNRAFNLSAVREPREMVTRHLLDSLTPLPYLEGEQLLDVGTGAGLPGIPLALCRPELRVTLLDTNGKKVRFLRQAVAELPLPNVSVVGTRVEQWHPEQRFDTIIARAYARLDGFIADTAHLLAPGGQLLAMKGRFDANAEAAQLPPDWHYTVKPLEVPGLDATRTLVCVRHEAEAIDGDHHG